MAITKKDHLELFHDYGLYLPTRTIELRGNNDDSGVNNSMAMNFLRNLHHLENMNKDPITVLLNTVGGEASQGMTIYDAIRASKCHITIKVVGEAFSMGSVILQSADTRILSPNASIMFHAGSGGGGADSPHETANSAEFDRKYMDRMYKIIFNKINKKHEELGKASMAWKTFENMNLKGRYMFAEEAIELGLADRIELPYDTK